MSFELGQQGRGITYLNFRSVQDETGTKNCVATQEFIYSNFIDESSDYVLAIERLRVPIHKIPMMQAVDMAPAYIIEDPGGNVIIPLSRDVYSLREWLNVMNDDADAIAADLEFAIGPSGNLVMTYTNFAGTSIRLGDVLKDLMDLDTDVLTAAEADANGIVNGGSSIFDRFDNLYKVQIEARGLNVAREVIDTDTTLPILTDIIVPTTYTVSYKENILAVGGVDDRSSPIAYPTRQAVLYGGENERRYINMVGKLAIQNITIQAVGIYRSGTRVAIPIPPRGVFECKLAFFKK